MARTWLQIRVELLRGCGTVCEPSPGRIFIVKPGHSFQQLAHAINAAFARWDLSHLHNFELTDGRLIGYPDDSFAPDMVWLDHAKPKVSREVRPGDVFENVFDLGDNWQHRCTVLDERADPVDEYGPVLATPVAIWGWGSIPGQYGRRSLDDDGDEL